MTDARFKNCIDRICSDDREGLRLIYEDYEPLIYRAVFDILGNRENAEDVTADFFLKIWEIAGTYKPGGGHRCWLVTIARNMALDLIRKRKHEELTDEIPEDADMQTESAPESVIADMAFEQAIAPLGEKERQILTLKFVGELTFEEIARVTGEPPGTVSWRYRTAIAKLRKERP